MQKNIIRNIFPNPLSINNSNINKNQQPFLSFRKIRSPLLNSPQKRMHRNSSMDMNEMSRPRFNINRNISKSSHIKQRFENYSQLMNNKFSYSNIYNDFSFQKAPSFNDNISEIHQIINGKKHKKIKYLDNLFFNSMFSNEYLDDIYEIRKNNILFQHDRKKLKLYHRNNSSGKLITLPKRVDNISRDEESRENESSTNNSNYIRARNNKSNLNNNNSINGGKFMRNNISDISTTTNKSVNTNKFPEIYSNLNEHMNEEVENKNRINSSYLPKLFLPKINKGKFFPNINSNNFNIDTIIHQQNDGGFITSLGVEKVKHKINELMFENSKNNKKINEFEKKILKLKILQIYQKENLELYLNDDRFNIQDRIDHILKMYKIYENIYEEYQVDLSRYINFLWLVTSDFEVELQNDIKKKRELDYDVEVLVDKLITKQKELENLIYLRNFLFTVKYKDQKKVKLNDEYVFNKSKRKEFIDFLLNLFNREPNTMATKYLKRLIDIEELEDLLMKKGGRTIPVTRKSTNKTCNVIPKNNDIIYPPPPGEKIFDKPEEFFKIIENLEDRNISLLKEHENIRLSIIELKNELNKYFSMENDSENNKIKKDIIVKIRKIKLLKEKNNTLRKKRDYLALNSLKSDDSNHSNKKKKIVSYNLFKNLSYFHEVNYNNLIIQYKYPGLLFLEKLIYIFNTMISSNDFNLVFPIEECNKYLSFDALNEILRTKKEYFNEKNQYLVIEYTLKLIKLYEYLGEFILREAKQYRIKNELLYKKFTEEIQNERKLYNARRMRKLIENKKEEAAKKLIEKWKKPIISGRKLDLDEKPFYLMRNLSQELIKVKMKKDYNNEFQNYKLLMDSL